MSGATFTGPDGSQGTTVPEHEWVFEQAIMGLAGGEWVACNPEISNYTD
jgi:hypothetical protein